MTCFGCCRTGPVIGTSSNQPCNGGCCDDGTCTAGTTDAVCGGGLANSNLLGTCTNCPGSLIGGHCAYGTAEFEYVRGSCNSTSDCNAPAVCQSSHCCLPSGSTADPSNPQYCCSDVVVNGECK